MDIIQSQDKAAEILESIGLNKNEIVIYIDLIKQPNSSALEISKRTKIHRSNTYDSLRKLIEKGFVIESLKEKKRIFQAIDPEKIKDYLRQKEREFDVILPHLKNFSQTNYDPGNISIGEGTFAAREALQELLKSNEPIYVFGASQEAIETFGEGFLKDFHKNRIRKKIPMLHIYNKSAIKRIKLLNKLKLTEARYLSEHYNTIASTNVCGDTVIFFIFARPLMVITLRNKEIADAYKRYFELMWKFAKI